MIETMGRAGVMPARFYSTQSSRFSKNDATLSNIPEREQQDFSGGLC